MSPEELFVNECLYRRWDKVREMISDNAALIWTAKGGKDISPVYCTAFYGNLEILQAMYDAILSAFSRLSLTRSREKQILRDAFERGRDDKITPAHVAASQGHVNCLEFLVTHCPSGNAILEKKDDRGNTAAHQAASGASIEALEFVLRNSPNGVGVLKVKNVANQTPLDMLQKIRDHFTPQKIRKIGFERDSELIQEGSVFAPYSLISLVLGIIQQNIELGM